jgi:hypothetical protein
MGGGEYSGVLGYRLAVVGTERGREFTLLPAGESRSEAVDGVTTRLVFTSLSVGGDVIDSSVRAGEELEFSVRAGEELSVILETRGDMDATCDRSLEAVRLSSTFVSRRCNSASLGTGGTGGIDSSLVSGVLLSRQYGEWRSGSSLWGNVAESALVKVVMPLR